jgi:hypothetical protein
MKHKKFNHQLAFLLFITALMLTCLISAVCTCFNFIMWAAYSEEFKWLPLIICAASYWCMVGTWKITASVIVKAEAETKAMNPEPSAKAPLDIIQQQEPIYKK